MTQETLALAYNLVHGSASNPIVLSRALNQACQESEYAAARVLWEHLGEVFDLCIGYSDHSPHNWNADYELCEEANAN